MIKKVVLTGGPSSGKTTVLNSIVKEFNKHFVKVIVVPETATELITAGVRMFGEDKIDALDFQELVIRTMIFKEDNYYRAAEMYEKLYPNQDVLIILDRAIMDNLAYVGDEKFIEVLNRLGLNGDYSQIYNRYDLVINLVSNAKFFTLENNKARTESTREALELGQRTLAGWIGHKNLKIVSPKENIDEKINEVVGHINVLLNKEQLKLQKKYLVNLKNSNLNEILKDSKVSYIEQAYLISEDNVEKRIRKTVNNNYDTYELAVYKIKEDGSKVLDKEKNISKKIYNELLQFKAFNSDVIRKARYYFSYGDTCMYLDIFEDNNEIGYLEINYDWKDMITLPSYLDVISDVSNEDGYSNRKYIINDINLKRLLLN